MNETWCTLYGCTDPTATNYDPNADCDNGCCVGGASSINELNQTNTLIYPNPAKTHINIEFNNILNEEFSIDIINLVGQSVFSSIENLNREYNKQIDISDLQNGAYFVNVYFQNQVLSKKLIISK